MTDVMKPRDREEVRALVAWAAAEEEPLEILGASTKRGLGRPLQTTRSVDLSGLSGVTLYEPDELVLGARAGTRLADIETLLAENRQQLAFEPADLGPLYGAHAGAGTIGGTIACNLSGPRRIKAGAARDHFLGFTGANGRGELFKAGGRVVKNVTGYDLCKLLAGSYGTLAAMTDVIVKVLPAPEKTRTVLVFGLADEDAARTMSAALNCEHEVSAAAHLPEPIAKRSAVGYVNGAGKSVTAVRIEGFPASVQHRCAAIKALLSSFGPVEELHGKNSAVLWREFRDVAQFLARPDRAVWRISTPPAVGPKVAARVAAKLDAELFYDWAGGLIWLASAAIGDAGAAVIRAALRDTGGHATLMRAPEATRAAVEVFEPLSNGVEQLSMRVKESFDPRRILNPGRTHAGR
jgi:glycolate oxidase FAD binding subunit